MSKESDLKVLEEAEPIVRTVLAILFYLRFGGRTDKWHVDQAYGLADEFIVMLKEDYTL